MLEMEMDTNRNRGLLGLFSEDRINTFAKAANQIVPEKIVPSVAKIPYRRWRARTLIDALDIIDSGPGDPYPYITLEGGATFHSFSSKPFHHSLYEHLRTDQKKNLVPEAYFTAEQVYLSLKRGHFDREQQYTIREDDTVLDIGPHHGYFTQQVSNRVGPNGKVIAVEAHPENYDVLTLNVSVNSLSNVETINKAVADEAGTIILYERDTDSGKHHTIVGKNTVDAIGEYNEIEVVAEPLDAILENTGVDGVDFVSITVNLGEYELLQGMKKLLEKGTYIACPCKTNRDEIEALFEEYGYSTVVRDDYYVHPIIYAKPSE